MESKKLIPELRFPEFSGEWVEKRLGEVCEIKGGKRIPKGEKLLEYNTGFPYITVSSMQEFGIDDKNIKFISKKVAEKLKQYRIFDNEIYISVAGTLGKIGKISKKLNGANLTENADKLTNIKANQNFLIYLLKEKIKILISRVKTESAQPKLAIYALKNFKIHLPETLKEQQKIASFLSAVDEKIEITAKKIEKLKEYKKGLLQKLLNVKNGVPELRFPEFSGKWVEKRLGEVCEFFKGKGISKSDVISEKCKLKNEKLRIENGELIKCIRYGELYTTYQEIIKEVRNYTNLKNVILSKKYDILIPSSGETARDISTASCILENGVAIGGDINVLRCKVDGKFLAYYLKHIKKKEIAKLAQGISVIHLYANSLKSLKIHLPPTLAEQEKIASFLSNIDEKIELNEQKLTKLKEYKKGLLQKMFV